MRIVTATDPGTPGWPNEDFTAVAPGSAVLLDGATTFPADGRTGCIHGVAWYARALGTSLLAAITADPPPPLPDALAEAIADVHARHQHTCDLTHPATPAATVTALREAPARIDYLALSDSTITADYGPGRPPLVITNPHKPAAASPGAADHATTGTLPRPGIRAVTLLSDGATRITDRYHLLPWPAALAVIHEQGPGELIRRVRAAEDTDPACTRWPRAKPRDDATITHWPQS